MKWILNNAPPLGIAILLSILFYLSIPLSFDKHKVELVHIENVLHDADQILYADMDGDGSDECIDCGGLEEGQDIARNGCSISKINEVYSRNSIEQVNVSERFSSYKQCFMADYNKDSAEELYLAEVKGNSIIINGFKGPDFSTPFIVSVIDSFVRHEGKPQLQIALHFQSDINNDGFEELFFSIRNSYPIYPRKIYRLDVNNKKLISGTSSCVNFTGDFTDTLNDGSIVFTGPGIGSANYKDSLGIPYSDYFCYSYLLDENLEFRVPPKQLSKFPNAVTNIVFKGALYSSIHTPNEADIIKYNYEGEQVLNRKFKANRIGLYPVKNQIGLFKDDSLLILDNNLETLKRLKIGAHNSQPIFFDLDLDGQKEMITLNPNTREVYFTSSNLEDFLTISIPFEKSITPVLRKVDSTHVEIVFPDRSSNYFYRYSSNQFYWLKWPYIGSLFLLSSLISFKSFGSYRMSLERKHNQETEMNRLQMLTIKNQVDPHFTLNALNSIDYMYHQGETDRASKYMTKLSRLVHQTLTNSDKFMCSLYEELDFIRTFCQLEEVRATYPFSFAIEVDEEIDLYEISLPKQLIFTYVENGIKHGLRPKESGGSISIKVSSTQKGIKVIVGDNGVGFETSKALKTSGTGKGLDIAKQLIRHYKKVMGKRIELSIESSENGTKVTLLIES